MNAASAVRAITNFFIPNSLVKHRSTPTSVRSQFPKRVRTIRGSPKMLLPEKHTLPKTKVRERSEKWTKSGVFGPERLKSAQKLPASTGSCVQGAFVGRRLLPQSKGNQAAALVSVKPLDESEVVWSGRQQSSQGRSRKEWAMSVNERWRICFEFRKAMLSMSRSSDYHKG